MITNQLNKADLHIHSTYSDGTANIPEILAHVAASDVRVIAITDHDSIAGGRQAAQLARGFGVQVVVGEEVSTAEGHLLALFIEDELPPGRPAAETIAAAHAQGGLCIAAHPYDRCVPSLGAYGLHTRSAGPRQGEWPLDAIEGLNAGVMWAPRRCNSRAQQVARDLLLPVVGGSDAHSLAPIGQAYTLFPGTSADDLYRAIQRGDVHCGGGFWSVKQHIDVSRRWLRQRGLHGLVRLALDGAGITQRKRVELPEKGLRSSLPI
jgi:predicted metal-dependent phosphoesterase TrpH